MLRHHTIQINQLTRCSSFTSLLLDVYVCLNMFRAPLRLSSGASTCTRSFWFNRWRVAVGGLLIVVARPRSTMQVLWERDGTAYGSISFPLASSHITCMTYTWCCMYSLRLLMMDGETRPKHVECFYKIKQIWDFVLLVGIAVEIYYDARYYRRQTFRVVLPSTYVYWPLKFLLSPSSFRDLCMDLVR